MTVELKQGYTIDSFYDKQTRSYITTLRDKDGNQVRNAYYSGNMTDRNADIQHIKEFFFENIYHGKKSSTTENDNTKVEPNTKNEDDEYADMDLSELFSESFTLDQAIKNTKSKTKKSKLPALSTLTPIMPDGAAGIATFNSGVGLSEDYIGRDELIKRLKSMGYKYNYPKYTDEELFEIYKKSVKAQQKKQAEKKAKAIDKARKQRYKNKLSQVEYDEDSDTYSDGSYYKNGIEFESEDAAREYFGESMNNKFYVNNMHEAWDIEEDLYDEFGEDPESLRIECIDDNWAVRSHDGNDTYYFGNDKDDCVDWCQERNERYYFTESLNRYLNESFNSAKKSHGFKTIQEGLKYFERKEFSENCRDAELELLYEGIKNNLDQEDIKKLGNFLKKADSADDVATFIKGLLSEDINRYSDIVPYEDRKYWYFTTHGIGPGTIPKDLHVLEVREGQNDRGTWGNFICLDGVLNTSELQKYDLRELAPTTNESLTEARKPKFVDTMFGKKVKDAMDRGELTYDNIEEWNRKYNGGIDPIPPFNTKELMNYFKSLNEDVNNDDDKIHHIIDKIMSVANDNGLYPELYAVSDVEETEAGDTVDISFVIDGDWKHEHLFFNNLVNGEFGEFVNNIEEDDIDDSESDTYSSIHTVSIVLDDDM